MCLTVVVQHLFSLITSAMYLHYLDFLIAFCIDFFFLLLWCVVFVSPESLLCIWTLGSTIVNYISHVCLHGIAGVLYFSGFPTWGSGLPQWAAHKCEGSPDD